MDLTQIPNELDEGAGTVLAVIETPRGGRTKYAYEPAFRAFRVKHLLAEGLAYPLDFGFIPGTGAQDGDPLDVMVLADEPLATGAVTPVRLVGLIAGEQTEKGETIRNDRVLAVAANSLRYAQVTAPDDLGEAFLKGLTGFWETDNARRGRTYKVLEVGKAAEAVRRIARTRD
jgi:inorganic pyrophosphatase